jgi:hypothetical protein
MSWPNATSTPSQRGDDDLGEEVLAGSAETGVMLAVVIITATMNGTRRRSLATTDLR